MSENLVVVGGGPAGYTAAIYAARADLRPLVIEGFQWGGQLQNTTDVENYPGFPEGALGPEMMSVFRAQAERFGARLITDDATRIELSQGGTQSVWVGEDRIDARAVILAMGATPKRLGIPGEQELSGRGVSTCGVCDGAFFRDRRVVVIGGGDSAVEDALFVSKFARELTLIHRRQDLRASAILQQRLKDTPNAQLMLSREPVEFVGEDRLGAVRLRSTQDGSVEELPTDGAFVAIGHAPASELVSSQLALHPNGYVWVREPSTQTSLAGVFCAGDLADFTYRQAITAAGSGARAALDAEWYLRDNPPERETAHVIKAPPPSAESQSAVCS